MMRVVIVDDEMITRTSLKDFICSQLSDYEVAGTFSNGQEALDWMRTHSADIVITDIRMPEMDGLELSRIIQESYPTTMVIIISGHSEFDYAKQALQYNVSNYLLKPVDLEELASSLENCRQSINRLRTMRQELDYTKEEYELFFIDLLTNEVGGQAVLGRQTK